jgi:hypothetical protein
MKSLYQTSNIVSLINYTLDNKIIHISAVFNFIYIILSLEAFLCLIYLSTTKLK